MRKVFAGGGQMLLSPKLAGETKVIYIPTQS